MRIYEELFIVRPDATDEEVDLLIEQVRQVITSAGGTVDKTEKWGVRKLAYRIKKRNEGQYVLLQFTCGSDDLVSEIERRFRVTDLVLKYLTVRIDEKMKRLEKRRKQREKRARRRPAPASAAAGGPAAPGRPSAEQIMAEADAAAERKE